MIERDLDTNATHGRYILRPHRSATWHDNLWLLGAVALAAVPTAVGWALAGLWPILPLCGAELGLFALGLYGANHALLAKEVISFDRDTITIEAGRRKIERRFNFQRYWSRVRLQPSPRRFAPSRLLVTSHGRAVELGRFLTDEERDELADELHTVLRR